MAFQRYQISNIIILIVLSTFFSSIYCSSADNSNSNIDFYDYKLDRILEQLGHIRSRQDEINSRISFSSSCCLNQQPQQDIITKTKATSNRQDDDNKRDHDSIGESKDLFHLNNLATSSIDNSIPSSGTINWSFPDPGEQQYDSFHSMGQQQQQPHLANNNDINIINENNQAAKLKFISKISQHYESMFGDALNNLQTTLKEQLIGFRLTLNKLMNRVVDHSYQYNTISNQLTYIKEECSLAASAIETISSNNYNNQNTREKKDNLTLYQQMTNEQAALQALNKSILKSSDITMLVRSVSQEIGQSIITSLNHHKQFDNENDNYLIELNKLSSEQRGELKIVSAKLNEIDSVVKQSSLFLSKINTQLVHLSAISNNNNNSITQTLASKSIVITYNNSMNNNEQSTPASTGSSFVEVNNEKQEEPITSSIAQSISRWFSGSKVPNKRLLPEQQQQAKQAAGRLQQQEQRKCQSKTNLITPSSCQQLRLAGANCTGQYYVFVRGSIRHVYCDMNMYIDDNGGGWTVILRRIDKSTLTTTTTKQQQEAGVNSKRQTSSLVMTGNQILENMKAAQLDFNQNWLNYKNGFGHLDDWGEFFIGLQLLHQISYMNKNYPNLFEQHSNLAQYSSSNINGIGWLNQTELQVDLETINGTQVHIKFDNFYINDEKTQYKIQLDGCNSTKTLCEPLSQLNGAKFYTFDQFDLASNNSMSDKCNLTFAGWWLPPLSLDSNSMLLSKEKSDKNSIGDFCNTKYINNLSTLLDKFSLTKQINDREKLFYPSSDLNVPLKRIVLKIRRKRQTIFSDNNSLT